jgi:peptidoglycan/LPS O-acetylase OafA/YrhL
MRSSLDGDEHQGPAILACPVRCKRCNVRDMEGLSASVVLIAILIGVLLVVVFDAFCLLHLGKADTAHFLPKFVWAVLVVCTSPIGGLVYLLTQRLPQRSPEPPRKPVPWMGIGSIVLVVLIIGLWAGIKSAPHPQPQPAVQPPCPSGSIWVLVQELCGPL